MRDLVTFQIKSLMGKMFKLNSLSSAHKSDLTEGSQCYSYVHQMCQNYAGFYPSSAGLFIGVFVFVLSETEQPLCLVSYSSWVGMFPFQDLE